MGALVLMYFKQGVGVYEIVRYCDVIFKRPRMLPVQFVTLYKTCKPKLLKHVNLNPFNAIQETCQIIA